MRARERCNKIIQEMVLLGFENEITEGQLTNIIINKLDVNDNRTILNYIRALKAFNYLEEKVPHVYRRTKPEN